MKRRWRPFGLGEPGSATDSEGRAPVPRAAARRADFTVGPWRVRVAEGTLSRGSETVRIEPRVMDVLVRLAAQPGVPLSKDELAREVWQAVAVSDAAIVRSVAQLRRALGDSARQPSYVRTLPKRGYVLVAPVDRPAGASRQTPAARTVGGTAVRAAAAAALLALTLLLPAESRDEAAAPRPAVELGRFVALDETAVAERWSPSLDHALSGLLAESGVALYLGEARGVEASSHRLLLDGAVRRSGAETTVSCRLTDARSSRVRCADTCSIDASSTSEAQEAAARSVVAGVLAIIQSEPDA